LTTGSLDRDERGKQRNAASEHEQRGRRPPSLVGRAHDAEHRDGEATGGSGRAEQVDRAAPRRSSRHETRRQREHEQGDRDVDVEDPRPGDPLGDHAAEEDAGRPTRGSGRTVDRERLRQLLRVRPEEHHQ
jgi:hypothetical protein